MSTQTNSIPIPNACTPRDIVRDALLSDARKIELLKMIKDHNAAPWQRDIHDEAERELTQLLAIRRH